MPNIDVNGTTVAFPDELSPQDLEKAVGDAADQMGADSNPGTLKSAALGAMSGVPGAQAATAGYKTLTEPNQTFEGAQNQLEAEKDSAWDQHGAAYGLGKGTGVVATGLALPASLPAAAAVGAASGLDATKSLSEAPKNVVVGAGEGAVAGAAGNALMSKVIGPLFERLLPATGKSLIASLGPKLDVPAVEAYLKEPQAIREALSDPQRAERLAQAMSKVGIDTKALSEAARAHLTGATSLSAPLEAASEGVVQSGAPEADGLANTIKPIFDKIRAKLAPGGLASTPEAEGALKYLNEQEQRYVDIAAQNGGQISQQKMGELVRDLQKTISPSAFDTTDISALKTQKKAVAGSMNDVLKGQNADYETAMQPVAENRDLLGSLQDKFGLTKKPGEGYSPSESTNVKMGQLNNEDKTVSHSLLDHLKDKEGFDFLNDAKNRSVLDRFGAEGAGHGLQIGGGLIGFGAGTAAGHPWIGAGIGRQLAKGVDGGHVAKSILDLYIGGRDSGAGQAINSAVSKFGPTLVRAAKLGGSHLAATHFVLSTSQPEYQAVVKHINDNSTPQDNSNNNNSTQP